MSAHGRSRAKMFGRHVPRMLPGRKKQIIWLQYRSTVLTTKRRKERGPELRDAAAVIDG